MEQKGFWNSVGGWFTAPFNAQGSALNWVLFVGLIIIAAFLWQTVLIAGFSKEL